MKLKKIASLMLAGIMAVSMLAACGDSTVNNGDDQDDTVVVPTGTVGKVITALSEDVTDDITISASSSLEAALQKAVENAGFANLSSWNFTALQTTLKDIDGELNFASYLPQIKQDLTSEADDKEAHNYTFILSMDNYKGSSEDYVAGKIADAIENTQIMSKWGGGFLKMNDKLPAKSDIYKENTTDEYRYEFDYTAEVAVVCTTNSVTGVTTYVAICDVTRTPTKV